MAEYNIGELEIKAWRPQDGDVLIVRNTEAEIDSELSLDLRNRIRQDMGIPDGVKVLVVGRDWEFSCFREGNPDG